MKRQLLIAAVVALVMAAPARAASVTYNGGVFGIDLVSCSQAGAADYNCTVRYRVDFANFTGDDTGLDVDSEQTSRQDYLVAIDFMVDGFSIVSGSSIGFPSYSSGIGSWGSSLGEQSTSSGSGAGCASGAPRSLCADTSGVGATTAGGSYHWDFTVHYTAPLTDRDLLGARIRAAFEDTSGQQAGLMSLRTVSVPEPGSLAFLGVGLLGAALGLRRFHK